MLSGDIVTMMENDSNCFAAQNLNRLAELVRGSLPKLVRSIIGALITLDVHARDIVTAMVTNGVRDRTTCMDIIWIYTCYR